MTPGPEGVNFLKEQHRVYFRQAWVYRWISWICGWGASVIAALGGVWAGLYPSDHTLSIWTGLTAAVLTGIVQTVKPELWADAYYRGHLLLEQAIGDYSLGNATVEDLKEAWHQAEAGLPGGNAAKTR